MRTWGAAALLVVGLGVGTPAAIAVDDPGQPIPGQQTSDGLPGRVAPPARAGETADVSNGWGYTVVPGLRYQKWDEANSRGRVRIYTMTADLRQPGLRPEYLTGPSIPFRKPLTSLVGAEHAVGAVNGDFFDIHDTGGPLGVGVDPANGLRNGPASGWNWTFYLDPSNVPRVAWLPVTATIPERNLTIKAVNSPTVPVDGIGIFTRTWGSNPGEHATDGQTHVVRQVTLQGGKVVANTAYLTPGAAIGSAVLIGRGAGASAIARIPVGTQLSVQYAVAGTPRLAISGSALLVRNGALATSDDGVMHPRTAIGTDATRTKIIVVVVDGRQSFSRGYTLLETANLMRRLGAYDAINLDGGGSSTMVGRWQGKDVVLNSPSDGAQRPVPNGLGFTYSP